MPTAPTNLALGPEKYAVYLKNADRELALYRVQSIEPSSRGNLENDHELGTYDPVGTSSDPKEPRVVIEQNLVSMDTELLLGKKAADATSVNLADLVALSDLEIYEVLKDKAGTITAERQVKQGSVVELAWNFSATGALTKTVSIGGQSFVTVTSGMHAWPAGDASLPGSIRGKDAVLYLGGSGAGDTVFRVQTFGIRAAVPTQTIRQLGDRDIVGVYSMAPTVTVDFDILEADLQPETLMTGGTLDFNQATRLDGYIRIFDPATVGRAKIGVIASGALLTFKLDQLEISDAVVGRAQVRNLGTKRFTLTVAKANTPGTAGLILYKGEPV